MRFLDLFWWFLDGDKSTREIIAAKQQKPVQQHELDEEFNGVDESDFDEEFGDFGDFDEFD